MQNAEFQRLQQHRLKALPFLKQHFFLQALTDQLLERLQFMRIEPQRILQIGGVDGVLQSLLLQRFPTAQYINCDVIAVDNATVCASPMQLPFTDQSVDVIVSVGLLTPWVHEGALFAELQRVLSPRGLVLFVVLGPDSFKELLPFGLQVDARLDMHYLGDLMLQARLADPVVDMQMLTIEYEQLAMCLHDIQQAGAGCLQTDGVRYQSFALEQPINLSVECVFAHAWGSVVKPEASLNEHGEAIIPLSSISTKNPG